jgi:hypothetical protein
MASKSATHVEPGDRRGPPFRWTALWIGALLVSILAVAILVGALIHNLNQTRMVGIFAIGVVSFLGMLAVGHQSGRVRAFEPGEVRTALTTSFAMVFFASVAIFLFSTNEVGDFGRTLMDNLTSLFGVVLGFYFASSAAVEYAKIKETGRSARAATADSPAASASPQGGSSSGRSAESPNGQAALEAEVAALRAAVEALTQKVDTASG